MEAGVFAALSSVTDTNRGRLRTRFWFNAMDLPSGDMALFSMNCGPSSFQGAGILLTSTGTLRCFYNTVNGGPYVPGTATTGTAPENDPEGWVRVDLEIEGHPNGTSDEINVDATVYFPDGTNEAISVSFTGSLGANFSFQTMGFYLQAGAFGFGNLTADILLDDWIMIGATNADEPGMSALPTATRIQAAFNTGQGASSGWTGNWAQASKRAWDSTGGSQTAGSAGLDTTFTHETAAALGLSGIEGISLVALATAGSSLAPTFLWNGGTYSGAPNITTSTPGYGTGGTRRIITGAISNAAFDAAEWGLRSVHASSNTLNGIWAEILHAGNANSEVWLNPGAGYQHQWVRWTGDGAAQQTIAGVGFRPHVVYVVPISNDGSASNMPMVATYWLGFGISPTGTHDPAAIISFTSDGFIVGGSNLNASAQKYAALCVRDDGFLDGANLSFAFVSGVFNGQNRTIVWRDTNGEPAALFVAACPSASGGSTHLKTPGMGATESGRLNTAAVLSTTGITGFLSNGFTTGADLSINNTTDQNQYFGWIDRPGVSSILQTGVAGPSATDVVVSISGVHFVLVRGDNNVTGSFRMDEAEWGSANSTAYGTNAISRTNGIVALGATSFTIDGAGSNMTVSVEAYWLTLGELASILPPVGVNDNYTTEQDVELNIAAGDGVLANDDDTDAGTLTAELVTNVSNGILVLNSDGSFDYTPNGGFSGVDSFTYRPVGSLGGDGSIATVTITVTAVTSLDLPVIVEMRFGASYREYIKTHPDVMAFYYLDDVNFVSAQDKIVPNDAGLYAGNPNKARGMLPEYGLSTLFDGSTNWVTLDWDSFGFSADDPFSIVALVRPASIGAAQCIVSATSNGFWLGLDATGHFSFGKNGGTKATSGSVVTEGDSYLVIGTYDGTDARLYVAQLNTTRYSLADSAISLVAGPTTVSIGPNAGADVFIGKNNSEEFDGDIQGVALFGAALPVGDVEDIYGSAVWVDVSDDVRASVPVVTDRGIHSDRPGMRLAPTGTATLAMNNAHDNTGEVLGYYSPGHVNCREGFERGIPVRISMDEGIQFIGVIRDIKPVTGKWRDRLSYCFCTDWMDEAARFPLKGIETQEDIRANEVINLILDRMENKPHYINIQQGTDIYPIALDNQQDESATAHSEFGKLMLSELGLCYVTGDGTLTAENRSSRLNGTTDHVLDNAMIDGEPERSTDQLVNLVKVTVHPRRVDAAATTVLYSTDRRTQIDNGANPEIFLQFRDPNQEAARVGGLDVVTPVATTHYTFNTAEDGSGTNVTTNPNITVSFEIASNGIYVTIVNNYGQQIYMDIEVLGKGVYDYAPITLLRTDDDSISRIGTQKEEIDMPYQTLAPVGDSAALFILNTFASLDTRLKSLLFEAKTSQTNRDAAVQAEIGTRVEIQEEVSGVDSTFYIQAIQHTWLADKKVQTRWWLVPADVSEYWILGTSELGINTRLSY